MSSVESSIYGLLGGDLSTALRFSGQHKYDDALYCHLRVLVDEQVDDFIRAEGKQEDTASRLPKTEVRHEDENKRDACVSDAVRLRVSRTAYWCLFLPLSVRLLSRRLCLVSSPLWSLR